MARAGDGLRGNAGLSLASRSRAGERDAHSRLVSSAGFATVRAPVDIAKEIQRRRTFAIISHPDAGKTTLTEKFLLYGNAIHLAGAVKDRKNQRATASDWMELEKQRGISISSTVLQFDYAGFAVNLLDTPGFPDFEGEVVAAAAAWASLSRAGRDNEAVIALDVLTRRLQWELIMDAQTANWANIDDSQSTTWQNIDSAADPDWTNIDDTQG